MLVLGSDAPKGGPAPWVTRSLIIVNVLAFLLQLATGNAVTYGFSLVPREFTRGQDLVTNQRVWLRVWAPGPGRSGHYEDRAVDVPQRPGPFPIQATLFSHMFLHAGWLHLLGNMWFLFVFGGHVERALRPGIFLTAYVTCGLAAGLAQVYLDPNSVLPCLGASGAISGVMGAYLFVHPFSTVRVWLWFCVFRLPALVVLGFWLLTQFLGATASDGSGLPHAGVAYGAPRRRLCRRPRLHAVSLAVSEDDGGRRGRRGSPGSTSSAGGRTAGASPDRPRSPGGLHATVR